MKTTANKMQIETAESLLNKTLSDRSQEIRDKAFDKDVSKYQKQVESIFNKYQEVKKETLKLKALAEKTGKLQISDNLYNSYHDSFPQTVEDLSRQLINAGTKRIRGGYNTVDIYMPDTNKAQREIDRFILNLKLGTAIMTDIDSLIKKINSIK